MHAPRKENVWQGRLERSSYLVGAILLHLVIFLLLATYVIWKPVPPPAEEFHATPVRIPPPPVPPQPSGGAAAQNPQMEPQAVVVPVATPASTITSFNQSFLLDAANIVDQSLSHADLPDPQGSGLSTGGGTSTGTGTGDDFGSTTGTSTQLTGYLYDLKQTSDKNPTGMTSVEYYQILSRYIEQAWDDSMLASYYKSKAPLFTDYIAISTRRSAAAPAAFGLQGEVEADMWVVHYRAKVVAPAAGDYRLAGFGDDVLMVKIKGATVLDAGWNSLSKNPDWHRPLPYVFHSYIHAANRFHSAHLKIGPTFHLDEKEVAQMDVLVGDGGGVCSFFLLVEKESNAYDKTVDGTPIMPFFQIGSKAVPIFKGEHPPYSTKPELWQGVVN